MLSVSCYNLNTLISARHRLQAHVLSKTLALCACAQAMWGPCSAGWCWWVAVSMVRAPAHCGSSSPLKPPNMLTQPSATCRGIRCVRRLLTAQVRMHAAPGLCAAPQPARLTRPVLPHRRSAAAVLNLDKSDDDDSSAPPPLEPTPAVGGSGDEPPPAAPPPSA